jgi:hypothetical protein
MVKIIGLVADAVQPHREKCEAILALNGYILHLAEPALEEGRERNFL